MQPFTQPDGIIGFAGTSAERVLIGTTGNSYSATNGTPFFETDTGLLYYFYGSDWYRKDGVNIIGSVYGSPANTLLTASTSAVGAAAGTIATSNDVSMYNYHPVEVYTLTATSVDVYGSIDGTNYVGPLRLYDAKTGALHTGSPLTAVGLYYLKGKEAKYRNLRYDQVGAGASAIRYAHGWV